MKFSDFIKRKEVRKAEFDPELFKSIVKTAELDLIFLEKVKIDEYSARKINLIKNGGNSGDNLIH